MYRLASATVATGTGTTQSAAYTYSGGKLATLISGDTTYQFNYGDFGLRSQGQGDGSPVPLRETVKRQ